MGSFKFVMEDHKGIVIDMDALNKQSQTSFLGVLLQLCLVSILGFILYCVAYIPDERTSMQFIVKVGLRTHTAMCSAKTQVNKAACAHTVRYAWSLVCYLCTQK